MKFKWIFLAFTITVAAAFFCLLPFAYSVARDIRRCRTQFPEELAQFEQRLKSLDLEAVYAGAARDLQRSVTADELASRRDELVPTAGVRLEAGGDWALFGCSARWIDAQGQPISNATFQFVWEDGQNRLYRVPGIVEPTKSWKMSD